MLNKEEKVKEIVTEIENEGVYRRSKNNKNSKYVTLISKAKDKYRLEIMMYEGTIPMPIDIEFFDSINFLIEYMYKTY